MMQLNDNEFDATFRKKVFDAEPRFEEAAWDKMEQKLRRRYRLLLFRKAGAVCLLFLICFGVYLVVDRSSVEKKQVLVLKKNKQGNQGFIPTTGTAVSAVTTRSKPKVSHGIIIPDMDYQIPDTNRFSRKDETITLLVKQGQERLIEPTDLVISNIVVDTGVASDSVREIAVNKKQKSDKRRTFPISLSLSAGPEFNNAGAVLGGRTGFNVGMGFSMEIRKRIMLQTGLRYSMKDYTAASDEYKFRSQRAAAIVSGVDASCAVLEIPVQVAYTLFNDVHRSIDLNIGLSSYIMLKEDYTYRYREGAGVADRFVEYNNQNQHYFGVAEISATYYLKMKGKGLQLGLEPYVKIPLTGVGEGKVNLKSSGVSLKLRYDLKKKNN